MCAAMVSTWRSYVYQSSSVGLSERPKPAMSGHTTRLPAATSTSSMWR